MKKFWKIVKYLGVAAATVLLLDLAVVLFFGHFRPNIRHADAIVVLGAAINTPALYNRSIQGLRLYQAGYADAVVASGGSYSSKFISEAGYIQNVINANSSGTVPVVLEDQSHDTFENLTKTKAKIGGGKSIIIVSDRYHLARAVLVAWREGFKPVYWSSPELSYYDKSEIAYYYLREMAAMIDYIPKFIRGR